jgi:hypothetical protein
MDKNLGKYKRIQLMLKRSKELNRKGPFFNMGLSRSGHNFIKENIESWIPGRMYINLENYAPEEFMEFMEGDIINKSLYNSSIKVFSVRDLLNWYTSFFHFFAFHKRSDLNTSRLKPENILHRSDLRKHPDLIKNKELIFIPDFMTKDEFINRRLNAPPPTKKIDMALNNWLENAKELKGVTSFLPDFTGIYYDEFVRSKEYRMDICSKLGGKYSEDKLNFVPQMGRYSTWDGSTYQWKGSKMKVFERYKNWKDEDRHYLKPLKDHPAMDFFINNFDLTDDQIQFIEGI